MRNIWLDGMMGLVVGDALGNPVQFTRREEIKIDGPVTGMEAGGVFNTPAGTWTDDSSMALATLSSINNFGFIFPDHIMKNFSRWLYDGEFTPFGKAFDEGVTCTQAIENYELDEDVSTCGKTGEFANGNGALMRILPVCLYCLDRGMDNHNAVWNIHIVTALTHNHPRAKMASGLYYFMAKEIVCGSGSLNERLQVGMDKGMGFYYRNITQGSDFQQELDTYRRLADIEKLRATPEDGIRSSGYVVDTLEAAVWSLANTDSYRTGLLKAVNLGDDADTVGAVAGGLAGLYYGYDAIPEEWLYEIKRRDWILEMCKIAAANGEGATR